MKRLLFAGAMLVAMLGTGGMAGAQMAYPPPPTPAAPGTEPATPRSPDPTLPFQAPGAGETGSLAPMTIGCRVSAFPNNGGTPGGLTPPAPVNCP